MVEHVEDGRLGHAQRAREQARDLLAQRRRRRRGLAGDLRRIRDHRVVLDRHGQDGAVRGGDGAPLGRNGDRLELALLGERAVLRPIQALQLDQPARHQRQRERHAAEAGLQPPGRAGPAQTRRGGPVGAGPRGGARRTAAGRGRDAWAGGRPGRGGMALAGDALAWRAPPGGCSAGITGPVPRGRVAGAPGARAARPGCRRGAPRPARAAPASRPPPPGAVTARTQEPWALLAPVVAG